MERKKKLLKKIESEFSENSGDEPKAV